MPFLGAWLSSSCLCWKKKPNYFVLLVLRSVIDLNPVNNFLSDRLNARGDEKKLFFTLLLVIENALVIINHETFQKPIFGCQPLMASQPQHE